MAELTPLDEKLGEVLGLAQAAQDTTSKVAKAGELGRWEIVQKMGQTLGEESVSELADWAVGVQRKHFESVREASLKLAEEEVSA